MKDFSGNLRLKLLKLDLLLKDIQEICRSVPSDYVLGRSELDDVRAWYRDPTKVSACVRRTKSALKRFRAEAVVAGEYNRAVRNMEFVSATTDHLIKNYRSLLAAGNYREAGELVPMIAESVKGSRVSRVPTVTGRLVVGSDGAATVSVTNGFGVPVVVKEIAMYAGGSPMQGKTRVPCTVAADSTMYFEFRPRDGGQIHGSVVVDNHGSRINIQLKQE